GEHATRRRELLLAERLPQVERPDEQHADQRVMGLAAREGDERRVFVGGRDLRKLDESRGDRGRPARRLLGRAVRMHAVFASADALDADRLLASRVLGVQWT